MLAGELTAACMGPTKVANVELHDNRDGTFHLAIKPMEVGRHILQIKYGGEHVLGRYGDKFWCKGILIFIPSLHGIYILVTYDLF